MVGGGRSRSTGIGGVEAACPVNLLINGSPEALPNAEAVAAAIILQCYQRLELHCPVHF